MIELKNVSFNYGEKNILKNFNLTVQDGERVCISGPSGCGKSTVIGLAAGILSPDSGVINADSKKSVVFQNDRLLPWYSVYKNVCLPLRKEDRQTARSVLERIGLGGELHSRIDTLSGGMQRRTAIARAISYCGDILLLDEAFNGIDNANKMVIADIINEYFDKKSILMVSHLQSDAELLGAVIVKM